MPKNEALRSSDVVTFIVVGLVLEAGMSKRWPKQNESQQNTKTDMTLQNYKHWLNAMRDAALAIQQHEFKTARLRANRDELARGKENKKRKLAIQSKRWFQALAPHGKTNAE